VTQPITLDWTDAANAAPGGTLRCVALAVYPLISACIVALQRGGRLLWMAEIHVPDMLWRSEAHTYTRCKASRKNYLFSLTLRSFY